MNTRCCVCRVSGSRVTLEPTTLPGEGWRCHDRVGCKRRVHETVSAHTGLANACDDVSSRP